MIERLGQHGFHARLGQVSGPALVLFTSEGCASCRRLKQVLEGGIGMALTLFEVDAHEAEGLAREFDVFHLPAMFLFLDGAYHASIACELRADALRDAVVAAMAAPAQEPP